MRPRSTPRSPSPRSSHAAIAGGASAQSVAGACPPLQISADLSDRQHKGAPGPNAYVYVDNKPLLTKDPTGLKLEYDRKDLRIAMALAEMRKKKALRAALDRMEADKKNVFKLVVVEAPPAYSRSTPPSQPLATQGGGFTIAPATPNDRGGLSDAAQVNLGGHYQYREEYPGSVLATLKPMTWESLIAHELGHEYANVYGGDSSKNAIDWENQMREPTDQRPYEGP